MGNRGRRRGTTTRAVDQTDFAAAECMKQTKPMSQLKSDALSSLQDCNQLKVLSIRWKKPRGTVVIQYADGSRYEGGVDDEQRRHGTGVYRLTSGHVSEGDWVHGYFEGCERCGI